MRSCTFPETVLHPHHSCKTYTQKQGVVIIKHSVKATAQTVGAREPERILRPTTRPERVMSKGGAAVCTAVGTCPVVMFGNIYDTLQQIHPTAVVGPLANALVKRASSCLFRSFTLYPFCREQGRSHWCVRHRKQTRKRKATTPLPQEYPLMYRT